MKTAKQHLIGCEHDGSFIPMNEVIRLMQAYARQEVEKHLEIAANEAKINKVRAGNITSYNYEIDKQSITSIKIELT